MRLYSKANLEVAAMAHKGQHRYALRGIYLAGDGSTVASDGRRMMIVTAAQDDVTDYPVVAGLDPTEEHREDGSILPLDALAEIRKALPSRKAACGRPVLQRVALDETATAGNGIIRLVTTDLASTRVMEYTKLDGFFPPINGCIPAPEDAVARITIGARALSELLLAVAKALDGHTWEADGLVTIDVPKPGGGLSIRGRNVETGQDVTGVMMTLDPSKTL